MKQEGYLLDHAEQRLASGILVRSLQDAVLTRARVARRDVREARYWLFEQSLELEQPFTFAYTLSALDQDPVFVRNVLSDLWTNQPDYLRKLVEEGVAFSNPARYRPQAPLFAWDKHGQLLLFGERLAA